MALDIKWERPDQRLRMAVTAPLFLDIAGERLRATEWSLDHIRIVGAWQRAWIAGEQTLHVTLPFQGFDVGFDTPCEVGPDPDEADTLLARFTALGSRERELMAHFLEELLRGSMVAVKDTIQRIDVPVMPTSLEPDRILGVASSGTGKAARFLGMSSVYGLIGAGVFGYLALMAYTSLYKLEVQSAVISAPMETVAAQAEGHVQWGDFKPGDPVKPGDIVLRLFDNMLERDIEVAEVAIREKEAKLTYLKRRERNGVERIQSLPTADTRALSRSKLELDELKVQLATAEDEQRKPQPVLAPTAAQATAQDTLKQRIAALKTRIDTKEFELKTRKETVNRTAGQRRTPPGLAMIGSLDDLEAQIELGRQEVQFAQERHRALTNQRDRLVVRAPFQGRLVDLPHVDRGSIRKGDIVAILEQSEPRNVTAYLSEDEVGRVGLGDPAKLYVPAARETLRARVARIDPTGKQTREWDQQTGLAARWRGSPDRTAKVVLSFEDAHKVADADRFRPGLPVVVVFEPRGSRRMAEAEPLAPTAAIASTWVTVRDRVRVAFGVLDRPWPTWAATAPRSLPPSTPTR